MPGLVLAGLTIAIGPGFARFSTGMMIFAQPELNVPTTPITLVLLEYVRAFEAHFAESQPPVWAVESSHDWKPIWYWPAVKFRCLSAYLIASTISPVCARPAPCSGRSDATMKSGEPDPS